MIVTTIVLYHIADHSLTVYTPVTDTSQETACTRMSVLSGDTKRRLFDCTTKPRAVSQHQKQTKLLGSHWRSTFLDSEPLWWSHGPCRDIDGLQVRTYYHLTSFGRESRWLFHVILLKEMKKSYL